MNWSAESTPLHLLSERVLPDAAKELIRFDMDSIRQIAASRRSSRLTLWLADPDQYEQNGRVLRDSASPRLLAYAPDERVLYATDGCNSCVYDLQSAHGEISGPMLERLLELIRNSVTNEL